MPVANINVLAGHPRPVLKALLREASQVFAAALGAPAERLQVWITEIDPELYAIGGEPADEVLATRPRGEVEIPFIRMALMDGRPVEMLHKVMADMAEVTARHLGGDPARVRVQIDKVYPDGWAIGGVPFSVLRPEETAKLMAGKEKA